MKYIIHRGITSKKNSDNSYMAITKNGYGYPFTCNINQINQLLSLIINDINQRTNEKL